MQIGIGSQAGKSGEDKTPNVDKMGRLGNHEVTKTSGRLLNKDVHVETKGKTDFTGDKTVPDGQVAQMTDNLGRTFIFSKK